VLSECVTARHGITTHLNPPKDLPWAMCESVCVCECVGAVCGFKLKV
jgi:hypothetical protein